MASVKAMAEPSRAEERYFKGCSQTIKCMEKASLSGLTGAFMKATGLLTRKKEKESTFGPMDRYMKATLKMIIAMIGVLYSTPMANASKACGVRAKNTAKASTFTQTIHNIEFCIDMAKRLHKGN